MEFTPPKVTVVTSDKGALVVDVSFFLLPGHGAIIKEDNDNPLEVRLSLGLDVDKPWIVRWVGPDWPGPDPLVKEERLLLLINSLPHSIERQHWWDFDVTVSGSQNYPAGTYALHLWCSARRMKTDGGLDRVYIQLQQYLKPKEEPGNG